MLLASFISIIYLLAIIYRNDNQNLICEILF